MAAASDVLDAVLVDANLAMWAHHPQFPHHERAREWWATLLSACPLVGMPWETVVAFLRLSTHARVLSRPVELGDAVAEVRNWLGRDNVTTPVAGERHQSLFESYLRSGRAAAKLVNDAHLAALATESGLQLVSADRDFARFPGLRWADPSEEW